MSLFKDELRIARLDDNISYIQPTVNPLSANVVIINSKDAVWLYDVGNHPDIPDVLECFIRTECCDYSGDSVLQGTKAGKKVNIVLSSCLQVRLDKYLALVKLLSVVLVTQIMDWNAQVRLDALVGKVVVLVTVVL